VAIVHVAPASTELKGEYVLSNTDQVIDNLPGAPVPNAIYPQNIISIGHGFIDVYLAPGSEGQKLISADMSRAMNKMTVVLADEVCRVELTPSSATLNSRTTVQLHAKLLNALDQVLAGSNNEFLWASDASAVATVDTEGLVTAVKEGSGGVTAAVPAAPAIMATAAITVAGCSAPDVVLADTEYVHLARKGCAKLIPGVAVPFTDLFVYYVKPGAPYWWGFVEIQTDTGVTVAGGEFYPDSVSPSYRATAWGSSAGGPPDCPGVASPNTPVESLTFTVPVSTPVGTDSPPVIFDFLAAVRCGGITVSQFGYSFPVVSGP
jgi:hypothetical protein